MKEQFHIQWHITNLCNLRCRHCYQDDFSNQRDLDWTGLQEVAKNILATVRKWDKTASIHLTGGEPLLKPELFPLLEYLDQNPRIDELGIITNGLLIGQEWVKKISTFPKLKKIKISLDGAEAGTNDSIRGKGNFSKVIQNLSWVKKENQLEVLLMFTVMRKNFRELPTFFNLSQDLGIHGFIIERFIPLGRGKDKRGDVLRKEEWEELITTLSDLFLIEERNDLLSYQAFQVDLCQNEPELLGAPCVIGTDGLCIMPNGDVFPCRRFPVSIGNLLEKPLDEIWKKSEMLEEMRRKENLKGKCGKCEIEECRGCRSIALALTGDYLAEDPHCLSRTDSFSFLVSPFWNSGEEDSKTMS
jgi:radical SAM protein with 4Fe4S-binding SPASM domain